MTRPLYALGLAAAFVFACDSHPTAPQHTITPSADRHLATVSPTAVTPDTKIVSFESMYGVDEGFVSKKQIRDVLGDELPWEVASAVGSLTVGGHLIVSVRGLVFADVPEVPPELRGINDETDFRALVSCLVPGKNKKINTVNIATQPFAATPTGDSDIDATIQLPSDCIAPIVFVIAGSEDKWFSVIGAETGG